MPVLSGIRVLDLAYGWGGAMAGMLLADQGAEIVRVDLPNQPLRQHLGAHVWLRGRRSLQLDPNQPESGDIVRKLALRADVLLADATMAKGATVIPPYDELAAEHPRLIYCLLTGYGEEGPLAEEYGHDHLVAARTGVHDQPGWREGPTYISVPIPSLATAGLAVQAIGAALYVRERTGRGQRVTTSLFAGGLAAQPGMVNSQRPMAERGFGVVGRHPFGSSPFYRIYECADGRWLHFGCLTPRLIQNAIRALELRELFTDPRFGDGRNIPTPEARNELIEIVTGIMRRQPYAEWAELFEREDVPYAPPQWTEDLMDDPQVRHLGLVVDAEDPEVGPIELMGPTFFFRGDPGRFPGPTPLIGQHTREVLEELGYASEDVDRLGKEGIISS